MNVENAIVAQAILDRQNLDRDGEVTLHLKVSLSEPLDLNVLRSWVKQELKLYLVKENPKTPQVPPEEPPF